MHPGWEAGEPVNRRRPRPTMGIPPLVCLIWVFLSTTRTNCIMPRSSWARIWQCSTKLPGKSTKRCLILTCPFFTGLFGSFW